MAKQYTLIRKIATVPVVAGGFAAQDLPRDHDYNSIMCRLSATLNVTTAATAVRGEAPLQLISRIQVMAEGKNMIFNAPAWFAGVGNMQRAHREQGAFAITAPTAATVAAYDVEAFIFIDFATLDTIRPKDSNFRAYGLSLFQIQFQFGQALDAFVPGAGVVSFTGSPSVEVFSVNCVEERGADGKYIDAPAFVKKVSFQEMAGVNSNASLEARLPAGNLIRSVLVRTEGAVTAGEPAFTQLNNFILQNSNDVRFNLTGKQVIQKNRGEFGRMLNGMYIADMVTAGGHGNNFLGNLWDAGGASEPKAILDITGFAAGKIQVVTTEYIAAG